MQNLIILGTGGTIAGISKNKNDVLNYDSASLSITQLSTHLPLNNLKLITEQVAQIDSKDMNFAIWQQLLQRCYYWSSQAKTKAIIITHGTDTIEETSYFIQQALPNLRVPIIFTCAMRPSNARNSDGHKNLVDACLVAQTNINPAVVLVCNGKIHHANYLQKTHATKLATFSSTPQQLIGTVKQQQVKLNPKFVYPINTLDSSISEKLISTPVEKWPQTEIIFSYVQQSISPLRNMLQDTQIKGVIIAATGNGTVSEQLLQTIAKYKQPSTVIWLCTRCIFGGITKTIHSAFKTINVAPFKARILLLLNLFE